MAVDGNDLKSVKKCGMTVGNVGLKLNSHLVAQSLV
jgi:hypothetical protein